MSSSWISQRGRSDSYPSWGLGSSAQRCNRGHPDRVFLSARHITVVTKFWDPWKHCTGIVQKTLVEPQEEGSRITTVSVSLRQKVLLPLRDIHSSALEERQLKAHKVNNTIHLCFNMQPPITFYCPRLFTAVDMPDKCRRLEYLVLSMTVGMYS